MNAKQRLQEIIEEGVQIGAFPGCTYAVVNKDKAYISYAGYKELYPNKIKNSVDTIYDMASLTKVISTTTSIMQLVEDGKIRIYDPVKRYLPFFKYDNINLWHLLTHTSGLPEGISGPKDKMNKDDVWEKIKNVDINFEPGTKICYSDINFIILGKIVEIVSKEDLNVYVKNHVFDPLEMYDTGYLPQDINRVAATEERHDASYDGYVKGKVHDETSFALGGVAGHAGLFSTVTDMTHFIKMILNDGIYNGKRILAKNTIDNLYKIQVATYEGLSNTPTLARCLGWQAKERASSAGDLISTNTILHTGFTGTNVWIDRDNKIGFVLLSNRVHPTRNNNLHMRLRAIAANYVISHKEEFFND